MAATRGASGGKGVQAIARLEPTKGSSVNGVVQFFPRGDGSVQVKGTVQGLAPNSVHGFHIHEFGVYSEDGMAAGGHFNPHNTKHAAPDTSPRHVGDLGNLTANENGNATLDLEDSHLAFHGHDSIIGRGVVVHAKADDFSQPVGNAGGRVAVGTIAVAKP